MASQNAYVGKDVGPLSDRLDLVYPIDKGLITDWDSMEKVWHYTFNQLLKADPEQTSVMLTETPQNHPKNKERMASVRTHFHWVYAVLIYTAVRQWATAVLKHHFLLNP